MFLGHKFYGPIVISLILSAVFCDAQSTVQQAKISASSEAAARLASLVTADVTEIRIFPGDDARASSADFDDSGWKTLHSGEGWTQNVAWLRLHIVVPPQIHGYDIRGGHLSLSLRGTHSARFFLNGVALNAGQEREPVMLTEHAVPGENLLVALYVTANNEEPSQISEAKILIEPSDRPDPNMLGQEFLVAEAMLQGLAPDDHERSLQLDAAIHAVDWNALEHADQTAFDRSLIKSKTAFEPLGKWMQGYSIHAAGNAHIDIAWLWPWTETVDVVHRTFSSALQLMREFPDLTYTQSSAQAYEWMEEKYPSLFEEIQQRVREGRWELIGGMWVEPDLNMPDGESQVRQLLLGKRYFKEKFGVDIRTGWNPDSFGYNWQLPQIYKKSGIDFFVTQKMTWNDTTEFPYKLFWWASPDGSRILTYFPHGYNNVLDPVKMARDLSTYAPGTKYREMLYLFGVGDHGGGPTRAMLRTAERWRKDAIYPRLSLGTVQPYFDRLAKQAPAMNLPVWENELYLEFHRGVYTTQAETKKGNRRSEELLLTTEKFSSFASLSGQAYPKDDLRLAWKKVLFNQFHDIAAGSGIPAVYKDAARDYAEVGRISREHLQASASEILSRANTAGAGEPVAVFNSLSWKRIDLVEAEVQLPAATTNVEVLDSRGSPVLSERISNPGDTRVKVRFLAGDLPPLGYKIFRVTASAGNHEQKSPLNAGPNFIENEFYRVRVDPKTGCITSLWNKVTSWESIEKAGCGNQLQAFADNPSEYDAWNIDADFERRQWNIDTADEIKLIENSPLRAVLSVRKHFQHSTFVQDITLIAGVARVDIAMHVDWREKHVLLKVAFPVSVRSDTATYEIPFGSIARPTTRLTPEERAKFEVPALRWADLSDGAHGLSLLNDSKYGYDCKNNVLRLTLLRSPAWPDPHADEGVQEFTYSLFPHGPHGKDSTMRRGYELSSRLIAIATGSHSGDLPAEYSFVSIEPENLIITALKQSEDGKDLVLRFYEVEGQKTTAQIVLPRGIAEVFDANLMEQEGAKIAFDGKTAVVDVGQNEIKTLKLRLQKMVGEN